MKKKKIAIVSDHAGYYLKEKLLNYLIKEIYELKDFGCYSPEELLIILILDILWQMQFLPENLTLEFQFAGQEMELI